MTSKNPYQKTYASELKLIEIPSEFNFPISTLEEKYDEGWALMRHPKRIEFKDEQIKYLRSIFDEGQRTGKKERPENVAIQMKKLKNPDGSPIFLNSQWMSKEQISCQFNKFTCQLKLAETSPFGASNSSDDIDEASIEEHAMDEAVQNERQAFEEFTSSLNDADESTGLQHPLMVRYPIQFLYSRICGKFQLIWSCIFAFLHDHSGS